MMSVMICISLFLIFSNVTLHFHVSLAGLWASVICFICGCELISDCSEVGASI